MAAWLKKMVAGCWLLVAGCGILAAQVTSDVKDIQVAKQKLQIGTDAAKYLSTIAHTISVAATHNQSPTAKAVYDYIAGLGILTTVSTTARLSGNGTVGSPLDIAQQGAATGQVLRWSGTAWAPNGLNLYYISTTSETVAAQYNQVWVDDIGASITLNLPACNAANNGVKIEVAKMGADTWGVVIEPSGSEEFMDATTSKTLFSTGTAISCTCQWTGSDGVWLFINM
jgi:hypothetical protein